TARFALVVGLVTSEHFVDRLELTRLVCTEETKQRVGDRLGAFKACPRRTRAEDAIGYEERHSSLAVASVQGVVQGVNDCASRLFLFPHPLPCLHVVTGGNGVNGREDAPAGCRIPSAEAGGRVCGLAS